MNELVADMLKQLTFLGADFRLLYEKDREKPWRLDVLCGEMDPLSNVSTTYNLLWIVTFAVNTVIDETRKDEGIPLHEMPTWIE